MGTFKVAFTQSIELPLAMSRMKLQKLLAEVSKLEFS